MATSSSGMVAAMPEAHSTRSLSAMVQASSRPMPRSFVERTSSDRRLPWQAGHLAS